jgi:hypothetical protein
MINANISFMRPWKKIGHKHSLVLFSFANHTKQPMGCICVRFFSINLRSLFELRYVPDWCDGWVFELQILWFISILLTEKVKQ